MKYIIYCTTCTENGKIYIGVHKTENPDVFDGYLGNGLKLGWSIKNPHTAFQHAVKKYGYSKFKRAVLYVFDTAEEAFQKEAEIVNFDFVKRKDNYNTSLGGISPGCVYDKLYQYDLKGKFIREWDSVREAIEHYGCYSDRFNQCIKNKRSAFNCYWTKEYFAHLDITDYRLSAHSEIYCYSENGDFIKMFENVKDIMEEFKFTKASIEDACSHKRPIKGYYFLNANQNIINIIKIRNYVYNLTDKSISKYKNGKLIQTYPSINQAAKENHISTTEIKRSITSNEGIWSYGYSDNFVNNSKPVGIKIEQYDLSGNYIKTWNSLSQCAKEHPKVKEVLCGGRNHTHGFTFKIVQ